MDLSESKPRFFGRRKYVQEEERRISEMPFQPGFLESFPALEGLKYRPKSEDEFVDYEAHLSVGFYTKNLRKLAIKAEVLEGHGLRLDEIHFGTVARLSQVLAEVVDCPEQRKEKRLFAKFRRYNDPQTPTRLFDYRFRWYNAIIRNRLGHFPIQRH
jgi:hypothetical protein